MENSTPIEENIPLVNPNSPVKTQTNHTKDVHVLSLAFLLVFSSYGAVQNLESTVNTDGDLGTISLGILYVSFMVFSLFASLVVRKLGSKNSVMLGTTGYWIFTAANLMPNWYGCQRGRTLVEDGSLVPTPTKVCQSCPPCVRLPATGISNGMGGGGGGVPHTCTRQGFPPPALARPPGYTMVPASIYTGFSASIIWVGQGTYLTSTACSHARDCSLHEGTVIGNFNGVFWGIYPTNQVIGNLLSLVLLKDGTDGGTSGTTMLFIVFLCIMIIGSILMCFLRRRDVTMEEQPKDSSVSCFSFLTSVARSVVKPLFDIRILMIIPLFAYSGLQQAFVWAEFTKKIIKPALGESGIGGSMAIYGAADAICSLVAGRLTSSLNTVTWITVGGSLVQAIVLFWILLGYSTTSGVLGIVYPLLMAAALGIGDGVLMTQINALLGMLFKHDMLSFSWVIQPNQLLCSLHYLGEQLL